MDLRTALLSLSVRPSGAIFLFRPKPHRPKPGQRALGSHENFRERLQNEGRFRKERKEGRSWGAYAWLKVSKQPQGAAVSSCSCSCLYANGNPFCLTLSLAHPLDSPSWIAPMRAAEDLISRATTPQTLRLRPVHFCSRYERFADKSRHHKKETKQLRSFFYASTQCERTSVRPSKVKSTSSRLSAFSRSHFFTLSSGPGRRSLSQHPDPTGTPWAPCSNAQNRRDKKRKGKETSAEKPGSLPTSMARFRSLIRMSRSQEATYTTATD